MTHSLLSGVEVCIWDVDGTLYHTRDLGTHVEESAYSAIMNVMGMTHEEAVEKFSKVHHVITESATEAVSLICRISVGDAAKLTDKYLDRMQFVERDEKLIALFESLRGLDHYILGNGSIGFIEEALDVLGLDRSIFKEIVTSEIVGRNKPNPAGYTYIMDKTGKYTGAHLMIGDREMVDLRMAKELGMKTALVFATEKSTLADVTLPTVYELSQLLY